jgi:hypothetical protein
VIIAALYSKQFLSLKTSGSKAGCFFLTFNL